MRCFLKALASYADFESRAGRREFWMFLLVWALLGVLARAMDVAFPHYTFNFRNGIGIFEITWLVALMLPWLAISVRRLHDTGRSGWWVLTVPIVPVYLLLMALPGESGENRYGRPEPAWC